MFCFTDLPLYYEKFSMSLYNYIYVGVCMYIVVFNYMQRNIINFYNKAHLNSS